MKEIYKKKAMTLNTYAMVLESRGKNCLCIEAGYSLEEALKKAKDSLRKKRIDFDIAEATLFLWRKQEVNKLLAGYETEEVEPRKKTPPKDTTVSGLMQEIIDNNDWTLFEKSKHKFTTAEVTYVESRLKAKD